MLHARLATVALATAATAVAGCGGSSKNAQTGSVTSQAASKSITTHGESSSNAKSASGKSLTRAQLVARGNEICARVNAKRAATSITTHSQLLTLVPRLAAFEESAALEMGKLLPPASMAADWRQIVSTAELIAADTANLGLALRKTDLAKATASFNADASTRRAALALAERDGFKECLHTS
jgi:hypothetical protein